MHAQDATVSPDEHRRGALVTWRTAAGFALALCTAATPALSAQAHAQAPETGPGTAVWQRLADCESGANWQADTGNGYYGGLQFDQQTWQSYGGDRYAGYANEASPREQISIGEAVRKDRGDYGAWPACAQQLGLPT